MVLLPAMASATRAALQLVRKESWRREQLLQLVDRFRSGAEQLGLAVSPSTTPIQPVIVRDPEVAMRLSDALRAAGILVTAIRPPTVPEGEARLRFSLTYGHQPADLEAVIQCLRGIAHVYDPKPRT